MLKAEIIGGAYDGDIVSLKGRILFVAKPPNARFIPEQYTRNEIPSVTDYAYRYVLHRGDDGQLYYVLS